MTDQEDQNPLLQDLSSQDTSVISTFFKAFGVINLHYANKHGRISNAFNTIRDPNLSKRLLDFSNPYQYQFVRQDIKSVSQMFAKSKDKNRLTSQYLFWKGSATRDDVKRAEYAAAVAGRVRSAVCARTNELRTQDCMALYGVTDPEAQRKFREGISARLKAKPGTDFDSALHAQARTAYLTSGGSMFFGGRKTFEESFKNITKASFEDAQVQAYIERGTTAIDNITNRNNAVSDEYFLQQHDFALYGEQFIQEPSQIELLQQELDQIQSKGVNKTNTEYNRSLELTRQIDKIRKTVNAPTSQTAPQIQPPTPGPEPTLREMQIELDRLQSKSYKEKSAADLVDISKIKQKMTQMQKTAAPFTPSSVSVSPKFFSRFSNMFSSLKNSGFGKVFGKLGGLNIGGLLSKGLVSLGAKFGLSALGGILSGGTSLALQAGAEVLSRLVRIMGINLDFNTLMVNLVIAGVVIVPIVGMLLFLIFTGGTNSTVTHHLPTEPLIVKTGNTNVSMNNWQEFEKENLTVANDSTPSDWKIFEKESLLPRETFLTNK